MATTSRTLIPPSGYHRIRRRWTTSSLVVLSAVMMLLLSQQTAGAAVATDNIVPTSRYDHTCLNATQASPKYVCQTDNASTGWRAEAPIDTTTSPNDTPAETSINTTMANSYDGTDLDTYFDTTPVYSGAGETDVVYRSKPSDFGSTGFIGGLLPFPWASRSRCAHFWPILHSCRIGRRAGAVKDGAQRRRAAARSVLDRTEHRPMMGGGGTAVMPRVPAVVGTGRRG